MFTFGSRYKAGKRVRRKVTGRTKTEVKAKLRDLRHDLDSGVRPSGTYTVGNALDDWLANGLSGRSARTRELYRDTVKALREPLGDVKLRALTAGDVQETLDVLAGRLSTRSLQIVRNWLERGRCGQAADRKVGSPVQEPDSRASSETPADCRGFPPLRLRRAVGDDRAEDGRAPGAQV